MGWFIVVVMVLSIFGIFGSFFAEDNLGSTEVEYNGFKFNQYNTFWRLNTGGQNYDFQYFPAELENITVSADLSELRTAEKVYIGYLPNDTFTIDRQRNFLGAVLYSLNIKPQLACLTEEGCPDVPLIDCKNKMGVVLLSGKENEVTNENKCLFLKAADVQELHKLTERLIYKLLGVMK